MTDVDVDVVELRALADASMPASNNNVIHTTGCANKKQSPRKKFYIYGIVADFFTRFMLFTEEDLGHVSSKLHLNIWFDSKIITI